VKSYEEATGFINLENLSEESNEIMEGYAGGWSKAIVSGLASAISVFLLMPTTACTPSCP
jgi:hypothetical protein